MYLSVDTLINMIKLIVDIITLVLVSAHYINKKR